MERGGLEPQLSSHSLRALTFALFHENALSVTRDSPYVYWSSVWGFKEGYAWVRRTADTPSGFRYLTEHHLYVQDLLAGDYTYAVNGSSEHPLLLRSDSRNLFENHYTTRASKISAAAHSILHVDSMVNDLPPAAGKTLYTARLEPLLLYGCEAMPDTDDALLHDLTEVQTMFIRSLLGVHKRAVLAPLYTETGLIPLKYRRVELVLRYLQYVIESAPNTYVRAAIADSVSLAASGEKSWYMDLQLVVSKLRGPFALPAPREVTMQALEQLRSKVDSHMRDEFVREFTEKKKLYLLRNRKGPVLALRPYLGIRERHHRESLTHLLLSTHTLAVERLRWVERYRLKVPYAERLCRFCLASVETPEHALLECAADAEISTLREEYLADMSTAHQALPDVESFDDLADYLRLLLSLTETIARTAEWVHNTLERFDQVPMHIPIAYVRRY